MAFKNSDPLTNNLSEWVKEVTLKDDSQVTIRPILPEDASLLQEGFSRLSPETIYYRFLESASQLSDVQARRLATLDYHKQMAFVAAIDEECVPTPAGKNCFYASRILSGCFIASGQPKRRAS